jgi:hypothetical protein
MTLFVNHGNVAHPYWRTTQISRYVAVTIILSDALERHFEERGVVV